MVFDTDYRAYFSGDNPELINYEKIENAYNKQDNILIAIAPNDKNIFESRNLHLIEQLTEELWQIPYVMTVSMRIDLPLLNL